MIQLTKALRIRISDNLDRQLNYLKKFRINKAQFVRIAIQEKIERDLPELETKFKEKIDLPF